MKEDSSKTHKRKAPVCCESEGQLVERFAAIVKYSDDAIISKTFGGIVTSWNPAAEKMFGYTEEEMVGKPITVIFPPDRQDEEHEILAQIRQGEFIRHFETVRVRRDGSRLDVSATISPLKDPAGNIIGVSKILRDITESKQERQQINLLRTCISNINDIIIVMEPDLRGALRVVFVNEALERLTGYTPSESIDRSPDFLHSPNTDKEIAAEINEAFAQRKALRRQIITRGKKGSEYWMDVDISPVFDVKGRCTHFVGIYRDVTEFNRVLHRTEEQAALLNQTQDAILVRDLEGKVLFWNKGAERMYGWTAEEALGKHVGDLIYADIARFKEANAITVEKGEWSGELRHLTKDRHELNVEARWSLVRDKEGHPKSILAVNTNVTDKKKIESQFMRAQRMESIGVLAGGIAHDLNNIFAPIVLSIDMLKATVADAESKLILETIETSAQRGADIVQQVLSFARGVEGQRIEIQPAHLLRDIQCLIKDTFPKDIRLHLSMAENMWTILGDPTQVHQILLNLCVNARDAMPSGGTLTVSAENRFLDEQYVAMNIEAKPGPYVLLGVTDSGTGIPPGILDKIFEPFFTTKEIGKGTGLGLSTVMAIVKSHGGFANVYSEPGNGTTFKIYLPAEQQPANVSNEASPEVSLPRGNGELVLIVDDEPSILTITGQTLQAFGYRVLKASNGAEAIVAYAQNQGKIDVVLTDMAMPVMDGSTTIYALLRINPNVKIIAASGLYANGGVAKASSAGVRHFISKPYTAATLLKTLRDIIET
jgi:PAS domain S-box-containing protein